MNKEDISVLLEGTFAKKFVGSSVDHYSRMMSDYLEGDWEGGISKAGKFIEAALKAVASHANVTFGSGKHFKVDGVINALGQLPQAAMPDTIRLTIPRASRFIYDIASNRGARHDGDDVDPNEMDANVVVMSASWILGELVRYSQKGAVDLTQAHAIVESLTSRKYPFVEVVEGRAYFHYSNLSAPDVVLLALARVYPKRISEQDLLETVVRHKFKPANARMAVQRVAKMVDQDHRGDFRLLIPGLKRVEEIRKKHASA